MVMPSVKHRSTAPRRFSIENMRTPIRTPKRPTLRPHPYPVEFVGDRMTENKIYRRERYLSRLRPFYDADDLIQVITGIRR